MLEAKYNQKFGELQRVQAQHAELVVEIGDIEKSVTIDDLSRSVLEVLSKTTEASIKGYIEPLITEALQAVFGYNLTFTLAFEFERNQVIVRFSLTDEFGNTATGELEDMKGGGILDVVSIVLQFAIVELFGLEGPIILDEPGKFVDQTHQITLGQLILSFAERFKRQIIIVTHDDGICAIGTKRYHVTLDKDNISRVTLVKEGA
jgi:predicted ATPase